MRAIPIDFDATVKVLQGVKLNPVFEELIAYINERFKVEVINIIFRDASPWYKNINAKDLVIILPSHKGLRVCETKDFKEFVSIQFRWLDQVHKSSLMDGVDRIEVKSYDFGEENIFRKKRRKRF